MRVDMNYADVERFGRKNIDAVRGFADRAFEILARAVETERSTHRYQNRTGHLESNTMIAGRPTGGDCDVDVVQRADYASILNARGFSRFEQLVSRAFLRVDQERRGLEKIAEG